MWKYARFAAVIAAALMSACGGGGADSPTRAEPIRSGLAPIVGGDTSSAPPVAKAAGWAVMGSSSAAGAGAAQLSWAEALRTTYNPSSFSNLAVPGTTTYHGLPSDSAPVPGRPAPIATNNVTAALQAAPGLIVVAYPSNDVVSGFTVNETVSNLLAIRAAGLADGTQVMLLSSQPRDVSDAMLADMFEINRQVAAAVGECFVDVHVLLGKADGRLRAEYDAGDGLHPNDAGHAVIFGAIKAVLNAGLCPPLR